MISTERRSDTFSAPSTLRPVFGDRSLADVDAEFEQFTMDPWSARERIGQAHLADQFPDFQRDFGPASARARFPSPKQSKASATPLEDGLRLDDRQSVHNARRSPCRKGDAAFRLFDDRRAGVESTDKSVWDGDPRKSS
jgi:hypothetical protein